MPDTDTQQTIRKAKGCLYAAHGIYYVGAGIALGVLCGIVPHLLYKMMSSDYLRDAEIPALARLVIDHRTLMPLMAVPTLACGVVLMLRVPWRLAWMIIGAVAMVVPAAVLLYAFVVCMGHLYDPPPM